MTGRVGFKAASRAKCFCFFYEQINNIGELRESQVWQRCPNVCSTVSSMFCCAFYMQVQGRRGRKEDGEERGEGGQQKEEEELEGFDAMQTGSTKARRQKFSIRHKNKNARVPALVQSHRKENTEIPGTHSTSHLRSSIS